jgi:hypothetical protein
VLMVTAAVALVLGITAAFLPQATHSEGIVPLSQFDAAAVHKKGSSLFQVGKASSSLPAVR